MRFWMKITSKKMIKSFTVLSHSSLIITCFPAPIPSFAKNKRKVQKRMPFKKICVLLFLHVFKKIFFHDSIYLFNSSLTTIIKELLTSIYL
jgi:hypothetical protein